MTFLLTWSIFVRMSFDRSADETKENTMSKRGQNENDEESSAVNARMLAIPLTSVTPLPCNRRIIIFWGWWVVVLYYQLI